MYSKPLYVITGLLLSLCLAFQTQAQTPRLLAEQEPSSCGDATLTVNIIVEDIPSVLELSHMLIWDSTVLRLDANLSSSVTNINSGLPSFDIADFSSNTAHTLGVNWVQFNNNAPGTLSDGDTLYTIVFDVVGDIGSGVQLREFPENERPLSLNRPRNLIRIPDGSGGAVDLAYTPVDTQLTQSGGANDMTPPVVTCPFTDTIRVTVAEGETDYTVPTPLPWPVPTATDNCGSVTATSTVNAGDVLNLDVVNTVTYTFQDEAMNTSDACTFFFEAQSPGDNDDGGDGGNGGNNGDIVLDIGDASIGCGEDTVRLDIVATNLDTLTAIDYLFEWDPAIFEYVDVENETKLFNGGFSNFFTRNDSTLAVSFTSSSAGALNYADGEIFLTIVLKVIGEIDAGMPTTVNAVSNADRAILLPLNPVNYISIDGVRIDYDPFLPGQVSNTDGEAPVFTSFPADTDTIYTDGDNCFKAVSWEEPTFSDNCSVDSLTVTSNFSSGDDLPVGETQVVYTVRDKGGNTVVDSFLVTVLDTIVPTVVNCPDDVTVFSSGDVDSVSVNFATLPVFDDNCEVIITSDFQSGDNFPIGTTTVTFTARDSSDNSVDCSFDVTVLPFTLNCPQLATTEFFVGDSCNAVLAGADLMLSTTDMNIIDSTFIFFFSDLTADTLIRSGAGLLSANGILLDVGMNTIRYEVKDTSGLSSSCSFDVTTRDTIAPTLACPEVISVFTDEASTTVDLSAIVPMDNCSDLFNVSYILMRSDTVFASGNGELTNFQFLPDTTEVQYIIDDGRGNDATCAFEVRVFQLAVDFDCPDTPVDVTLGASDCSAVINDIGVSFSDSTMIDSMGYTIETNGVLVADTIVAGIIDASGIEFGAGTSIVTYSFTDTMFQSTQQCVVEVNVMDVTPPELFCPSIGLVPVGDTTTSVVIEQLELGVLSDCGGSTVSYRLAGATEGSGTGTASGETFNLGLTQVTYFAEDQFGNIDSCTFDIDVARTTPEFDCPEQARRLPAEENCGRFMTDLEFQFTNPESIASTFYILTGATQDTVAADTILQPNGVFFNVGITRLTYGVVTIEGDTLPTCTVGRDIVDNLAPVIQCPAIDTLFTTASDSTVIVDGLNISATDACPIEISYSLAGATTGTGMGEVNGLAFNRGLTVVTYDITDGTRTSTCNIDVRVIPSVLDFECPPSDTFSVMADSCGAIVNDLALTILGDSAAIASTSYSFTGASTYSDMMMGNDTIVDASGLFFNKGITTGTYTVTDTAGVSISCPDNIVITVIDDIDPVLICPTDTMIRVMTDTMIAVGDIALISAMDNCGILGDTTFTLTGATDTSGMVDASGMLFNTGLTTVTYSVSDEDGNIGTCAFDVNIVTAIVELDCPTDSTFFASADACSAVVIVPEIPVISGADAIDSIVYEITGAIENTLVRSSLTALPAQDLPVGITNIEVLVFDSTGNQAATCAFTYTVVDTIAPAIVCPDNILATVVSGDTATIVNANLVSAADNCTDSLSMSYTASGATMYSGTGMLGDTLFNLGTTTVQYVVSDEFGNVDSCSFDITVEEVNIQLDCPDSTTVVSMAEMCGAFVDSLDIAITAGEELVDSVAYTLSGATELMMNGDSLMSLDSVLFGAGVTDVLVEVFDSSQNVVSCTFVVTVNDETVPTFVCSENLTTRIRTVDTVATFDNIGIVDAADNCSEADALTITYETSGAIDSLGFGNIDADFGFPVGMTTVRYFVSDEAGNIDSCSFTIIVEQAEIDIICPADVTIASMMDTCGAIVNDIALEVTSGDTIMLASYALSGATDSLFNDTVLVDASGIFFNLDTTIVTYTVGNTNGAVESCSFNVIVVDEQAPTFTCPEDLVATVELGDSSVVVNNIALTDVADQCEGIVAIDYVLSGATVDTATLDASGTTFNLGITTVTYTATDQAGNAASCSFTVTVAESSVDITCPADMTISAVADSCVGIANDIAVQLGDSAAVAMITYEFSGATTTDSLGMGDASGSIFNAGTTTVTYTVTDTTGAMASCSFDITVVDNAGPNLVCPPNVNISIPMADSTAIVNNIDPITLMDNCSDSLILNYSIVGATTVTETPGTASGTLFNRGLSRVTYVALDENGNGSTCEFNVELGEFDVALISCPTDTTVAELAGSCGRVVRGLRPEVDFPERIDRVIFTLSGATDSTFTTSNVADVPNEVAFGEGVTNVNYTIIGLANDTLICEFTVTVTDETDLAFANCPEDITVMTLPDTNIAVVNWVAPAIIDDCGTTLTATHEPGDTFPLGPTEVIYIVSNMKGEADTCRFFVRVTDEALPIAFENCPTDTTLFVSIDTCVVDYTWTEPTIVDDTTLDTLFSNFMPGDTFGLGDNEVIYTAIDEFGDTTLCSFIVTVADTLAPMIVDCPSDTIVISDSRACGRVVSWEEPTAVDNCDGEVTLTSNLTPGTPLPVGLQTVTYVATDASGNTDSCSFTIEIQDVTPPMFTNCPQDTIVVPLAEGECEAVATWDDILVEDNCGIDTLIASHEPGDTFFLGLTTVQYIAIDINGNSDTCSFAVVIGSLVDVKSECPEDIVIPAADGECSAVATWTPPVFENECTTFTVTSNFDPGDTFPVGTTEVIYDIVSERGDTTQCVFLVTVQDEELPIFMNCPSDTTLFSEAGDCEAVYNWDAPIVMDNCSITELDSTHASGSAFPTGETVVRYTAVDGAGNTQVCEFTVRVVDQEAPVFDMCADTIMVRADGRVVSDPSAALIGSPITDDDCSNVQLNFDLPTATDGCTEIEVQQTDNTGLTSGSTFEIGTTTLRYLAVDDSGNETECEVVIVVMPLDAVEITISNSTPCEGDSITVMAENVGNPEAIYRWTGAFNATGRIVTVSADDLMDNEIFVEVEVGDGCTLQGMIPIEVQANPEPIILTNDANCLGSTLMLSGADDAGNDIVEWEWSYPGIVDSLVNNQNQTINDVSQENAGVYTLTVTTAAGCTATVSDTIEIGTPPANPELNIVPLRDSICLGDELMLIGTIDSTMGTVYNFAATFSDDNNEDEVEVDSDDNVASIDFDTPGTYTVQYWISNGGCVSDTATVSIFVGESPEIDIEFVGDVECINADSDLQLVENVGQATTYRWSNPDGTLLSTERSPMLNPDSVQNGTYILTASIGSCETIDSVTVEVSSSLREPILEAIDFACTTDTLRLNVLPVYDSTVQFVWTSNDTSLINGSITTDVGMLDLLPTNVDSGMVSLIYVQAVTDDCASPIDTVEFQILEGPNVEIMEIETDYTCITTDSMIILSEIGGEGDKINWTGPCDFSNELEDASFIVNFENAECRSGTYTVTIIGENGCAASESIDLNFTRGLPQLTITGDSTYCEGEEIVLRIDSMPNDSVEVLWAGPEGFESQDSIIRITAESFLMGDYSVTLLGDSTTCPSVPSEPFFVTVLSAPEPATDEFTVTVDQLDSLDVFANDSLVTNSNLSFSIVSSPFRGTARFPDNSDQLTYMSNQGEIGTDNFTYEVCYEGCLDPTVTLCGQAVVNVEIVFPPELCVAADYITPNDDGKNDTFIVSCADAGEYPNNELIVFNEWGDEVYRASPYNNDWDGTYNGEPLPDGTYFYIFTPNENVDAQTGYLTLFR